MNIVGGYGDKEFISKKFYGKGAISDFEGMAIRIPEKYKNYLKHSYGDYMRLPPKKEQQIKEYYYISRANDF